MSRYVDEVEAARLTGLSKWYFQQKRWKGGGPPYVKVGRAVRYERRLLLAWIGSHGTRRSTSQDRPDPVRPLGLGETVVVRTYVGGRLRLRLLEGPRS